MQAGYNAQPTTTATPWEITTVDFTQEPHAQAELAGGNFFTAVSRDPLNAIVEYVPNPLGKDMIYTAGFSTPFLPGAPPTIEENLMLYPLQNAQSSPHWLNPVVFRDAVPGDPTYIHPHGSVMFTRIPARNAEHRLTYMTKGESMKVGIYTAGPLGPTYVPDVSGSVTILQWNGVTVSETDALSFPGGAVSEVVYTASASGNFAFGLTINPDSFLPVTSPAFFARMSLVNSYFGAGPAYSHLGHRPINGIEARATMTGIRVNGVSLMVTPDAAFLAKGGRICGVQIAGSMMVESFVHNAGGGSATDMVINMDSSDTRDFSKGGYAFHKPYSAASYEMQTPFKYNLEFNPQGFRGEIGHSTISNFESLMEPPDGWLVYAVTTPPGPVGSAPPWPGGLAHVTVAFSIEYLNNDVWLDKKRPTMGEFEYAKIMELVGSAQQFHDNPLHIADLKRWYNGISPIASSVAPSLITLLSTLGSKGRAGAAVVEMLRRLLPGRL